MQVARNCVMCSSVTCARQLATCTAKKLSSSFGLNSDESVILQKLLLNVLTLCLGRNLLLFLMSVESSSGSVEGSHGK